MAEIIKAYVARYVVPFYFNYKNNGYDKVLASFRNNRIKTEELGLPKDSCWVEKGFWENYKSDSSKQSEMDIYSYLLQILVEQSENDKNYESNLGSSFVLKTNGALLKLSYSGGKDEGRLNFSCNDLGVVLFRNGTGFIWYDIEFANTPNLSTYVKFQHDFKELARVNSELFMKKTGKDSYETVCMGEWLALAVDSEKLGINFWSERKITDYRKNCSIAIPDKALLFEYLFIDESTAMDRMNLAFRIANGYDEKYNSPDTLVNDIYEPFGNTCFYTSKSGTAYVVSNNESNEAFFAENFKCKYVSDYFFIYILLLYQSYSCAHYSRLLTTLPAEAELFEKDVKYVNELESLDNQIKLFLVKSVYESVSNIQHQNGAYKYGKKVLSLDEDIKSLTIGLDALRQIESGKQKALIEEKEKISQEKSEKKDRALNKGIVIFGFLVVASAAVDAVNLVDWFIENMSKINIGHILSLGAIGILTLFMFIVLIINTRK